MNNHDFFINKCLELALLGINDVAPNPMVGCVIVVNGKIIGQGYHKMHGEEHAEVNAINNIKDKEKLSKATLYVNLEPCCHFGKTPPCSELIVKYNIPHVVIGCIDDFSLVAGKGIKYLQKNKIKVEIGILEKKCKEFNKRFFTFHNKKRPYIILKWAKSKDNYIAPLNQVKPFWMTCNDSKKLVHKWRANESSILVGTNTVIKDNPSLTVRGTVGKNPIRVIIDKKLILNKNLKCFDKHAKTLIFNEIKNEQINNLTYIKIISDNLIFEILNYLYKYEVLSIIVEGGEYTINEFLNKNIWDEARVFTSPLILNKGVKSPEIFFKNPKKETVNEDTLEFFLND
tara:strand:+ start:14339 stop:15367 length:1029 start_codon:yes stop_codon:yes gene_type:complete